MDISTRSTSCNIEDSKSKVSIVDTVMSNNVGLPFIAKSDAVVMDDDCAICYETLYRPATTECGHSACQSCMLHWAMTAIDVCSEEVEIPSGLDVDGMRFSCPTCRTYTTAALNSEQNDRLRKQYPEEYESRATEEAATSGPEDEFAVQNMVLLIGNSHRDVEPTLSTVTGEEEKHEWTFFIQTSHKNVIEKVEIILHPKFRENRLSVHKTPPFSITHLGWTYFTVHAGITLKQGWEWVDESMAVDIDKTRKKARLPVQWLLDFHGNGSRKSQLVKFKKVALEAEVQSEEEPNLEDLALIMSPSELRELKKTIKARKAAKRQLEQREKSA